MDESDADDIEPPLSLGELIDPEDIEPEDIAPEDIGSADIAPWAARFFFFPAVAMWPPEAIASSLDISPPDDMEPLDIALLEPEEPFDIASPAAVCATAAPATPALKTNASPVILAHRSICILLENDRLAAVNGAPHGVELR